MDFGPEMRYSLVSGYQRNGENVSGWDYCLTPEEKPRYRAIRSIEEKITSIMDGYMNIVQDTGTTYSIPGIGR